MVIDFEFIEEKLTSSIVSDILDSIGLRDQAMRHDVRPLHEDMKVAGRAATMIMADIYESERDTFTLQMKALDSLKKDEVILVCSNGSLRAALWGELLSTASQARGAKGAVIDGLTRDIMQIRKIGFPVFAIGIKPTSSKGRCICIDYGCPAVIGGVKVKPGDIVLADIDGIVVIPEESADIVLKKALEVVDRENKTRNELKKGVLLTEVYKRYGTL